MMVCFNVLYLSRRVGQRECIPTPILYWHHISFARQDRLCLVLPDAPMMAALEGKFSNPR